MEQDPVCGMKLRPGQEEAEYNFQGQSYHFCSVECQRLFKENPKQYMSSNHQKSEQQARN
ncbi:MAG TPA: YHS domain-containing protein [Chloroflexota bacterium]|nr:YHS domain-containing protein [Chloroflexota bacterium]